jgi:hypothetical protein
MGRGLGLDGTNVVIESREGERFQGRRLGAFTIPRIAEPLRSHGTTPAALISTDDPQNGVGRSILIE